MCDWIETFLVHGPGDIQGTPIELDDEFRRFIWMAYELWPADHPLAGRRVYRRAHLSRPKGRAKSELAGMIASVEGLGPVRFGGWDAKGEPVGVPILSPVIRCFATEEDQAGNTFENAFYMLSEGPAYDEYPGLDPGVTRINLPSGGSIISTTSTAASKDGGKDTLSVFDEVHLWVSPRLKALHATVTRNLVKRRTADGWALETSTMFAPGEDSVAEQTHKAAESGELKSFLLDHKQAPLDIDIRDDEQLRAALVHVYGAAAGWTNIDAIIDEFHDPTKRESDCRRYWLNQPWSTEDRFVAPNDWDACASEGVIPDGERIVVGFDGSFSDDSTAVVACSLGDMRLQVVGVWERPDGVRDWRVPRHEVTEAIRQAARRWTMVEASADPYGWRQTLEDLQEEGLPIVEFPQSAARMIPATKRFHDLVTSKGLTHDGHPRLRAHVLNAIVKTDARGYRVSKPTRASQHKIDLCVAAIMAADRATAADDVAHLWLPSDTDEKPVNRAPDGLRILSQEETTTLRVPPR